MFHRSCLDAGADADAMVRVNRFGISGTYVEATAALLARTTARSDPICPAWDVASGPSRLDLPGLAKALMSYCDIVRIERPILVGKLPRLPDHY